MGAFNTVVSVFYYCSHQWKLANQHIRYCRSHISAKFALHLKKYGPDAKDSNTEKTEEESKTDHESIIAINGIFIFLCEDREVLTADVKMGPKSGLVGSDEVVMMINIVIIMLFIEEDGVDDGDDENGKGDKDHKNLEDAEFAPIFMEILANPEC